MDVPTHCGTREKYEEWVLKVRTCLVEELGYSELLIKWDALTKVPSQSEIDDVLNDMALNYHGKGVDPTRSR